MKPRECRHKWFRYFSGCTIRAENVREMCGDCMATKDKDKEFDERLYRLEREGLQVSKGCGGFRAVSQVDANQHVTDAKGFYGDNGYVRDMLPRSKPRRSIGASGLFQA